MAEQLQKDTLYRASPDFLVRRIAGEILVVPVGESANRLNGFLSFNEVGAFLFEALSKEARTQEDLVKLLCSEYDVDSAIAESDVEGFLQKAISKNIVVV